MIGFSDSRDQEYSIYEDALDIVGPHMRWKEPTEIMELLASAYLNAIRERRDAVDRDLAELDRVRAEAQEWKTRAEQAERELAMCVDKNVAREFIDKVAELRGRVAELEKTLADARPYVYQALCAAKADGQTWRAETAEPILGRVDAALAGAGKPEEAT